MITNLLSFSHSGFIRKAFTFLFLICFLLVDVAVFGQAEQQALWEAEQRMLQVEAMGGLSNFCGTNLQPENNRPAEDIDINHRFSQFRNNNTWSLTDGYGASCVKNCDLTTMDRTAQSCSVSGTDIFKVPVVYTLNTTAGCPTSQPSQAELDAQITIMNDFMICQGIPMEFYQSQATRLIDVGCTYSAGNVTNVPNAVNIYVFSNTGNGTGCNGFAFLPGSTSSPTTSVMSYSCYNGFTYTQGTLNCNSPGLGLSLVLIHEMGHYFGLYHTHETSAGSNSCDDPTTSSDDCTNGDLIADTDADPDYSGDEIGCTGCDTGGAVPNCSFDNTLPNCAAYGTPNTTNNVMSYNNFSGCRTNFSECQKAKMIDALLCARGPQMCDRDVTTEFANGTADTNKEICTGDAAPTFTSTSDCYNWFDGLGGTANMLVGNSTTFTPTVGTGAGELDVNTPGTYTWYLGDLNEVNSNCRTPLTVIVYASPGTGTADGGMTSVSVSGSQAINLTTNTMQVGTNELVGWWFTDTPLSFNDQTSLNTALGSATVGGTLTTDPPNQIIKSTGGTPMTDLMVTWDCNNFTSGNTYYATPIISRDDVPAPSGYTTTLSPQSNISPTLNLLNIDVVQTPTNATLTQVCVTLDYNACESFATMNDLDMSLIGPDGTTIVLESFFPGSTNVSTPTTIDFCFVDDGTGDSGGAGCNASCFSGNLESDNSFSAFDGTNPNGTWVFRLDDGNNASFYPCSITASLVFDMAPETYVFPTSTYSNCVLGSSVQISCGSLPIELSHFSGRIDNKVNVLEWTTATESNSRSFVIERSVTGRSAWTKVGEVVAAGQSNEALQYRMIDERPLPLAYYRLRSIDQNGLSELSNTVILERKGEGTVSVYPVPASETIQLDYHSNTVGTSLLTITDVMGRVVHQSTLNTTEGLNTKTLAIGDFSAGVYFLTLEQNEERMTSKIVKE